MQYGDPMFINARNALIDAGATGRHLPFDATVQYQAWTDGPWEWKVTGRSVEYLADFYNDLRACNLRARIVNSETGQVIFSG
jgi:hypothetical protein